MLFANGLFSSESVSDGHPDKVCDQISDAVLDAFLQRDPLARVACETFAADQKIIVAGEFRTQDAAVFAQIEAATPSLVRATLRRIGYGTAATDIDPNHCEIEVRFNRQSPEIAGGVDRADAVLGAGDQGLMFGYATRETPSLMPLAIDLSHALMLQHRAVRTRQPTLGFRPDAKAQVTVQYVNGQPVGVHTVVLSTQHVEELDHPTVRELVQTHLIDPVIPAALRLPTFKTLINPAGTWNVGGPKGDTGLTGRKIVVDTYGGSAPHGGGAFSGKDPSKVDRSAAYMARYLAKTVVTRGWADRCMVQLAYAIGVAEPVSFLVEIWGAGRHTSDQVTQALKAEFNLTPAGIIAHLDLLRPMYSATAAHGHFGRNALALPWEQVAHW
jgi:S-adenosylmethionine synthetase